MWDSMTVWFINSVGKYVSDGIGGLSFFFFFWETSSWLCIWNYTFSQRELTEKKTAVRQ